MMVRLDAVEITAIACVGLLVFAAVSIVGVKAYDMPELIDPPRTATQKSIETQVYRFAEIEMQNVTYSNGNVYPSMTAEIQKYNFTSKQWETYGYSNTHMHNVKVDRTDVVDVSVGHTDRINPKH